MKRSTRSLIACALAGFAAAAGPPLASAAADLTATGARIGAHPAYVRVVVDFTGGGLTFGEVEATDPRAADGSVHVRVRHRAVQSHAPRTTGAGVRATVTGGHDRLDIAVAFARHRFKYLQVTTLHAPGRLVLDLYRSRPPAPAAEIPTGRAGCLALTRVVPGPGSFLVRGSERNLFEHGFVLRVRDRRGLVVRRKVMTAEGAWSARIDYHVAARQPGTLEVVADSAKDGALACIAQLAVVLTP